MPRRPEGVVPPAINRKDRLVDAKIRDGDVLCLVQRREELDEEDDAVRAIPSLPCLA